MPAGPGSAVIRVAEADDHAVARASRRALPASQSALAVGAECGDAGSACRNPDAAAVDGLVVDLRMSGADAPGALARSVRRGPRLRALVFSGHRRSDDMHQAFAAGARGYLTRAKDPEMLLRAVRGVAAGRRFLSACAARMPALERLGDARGEADALTVRAFEVLHLLPAARDDIELVRPALRLDVVDRLATGDEAR